MFDKVIHIVMSIIICGLIWELIDRILNLRKHSAEQWSEEERKTLDKQGKPPLKLNRIPPLYTEEYLRNEERIIITDSIESDISMEFYRNLEYKKHDDCYSNIYPDGYMQSVVEHNGRGVYIIFYDWRQNPLRRLADYFYKGGIKCSKYLEKET